MIYCHQSIRNSSVNSVNETSGLTHRIPLWRNRKPYQHHNKLMVPWYKLSFNLLEKAQFSKFLCAWLSCYKTIFLRCSSGEQNFAFSYIILRRTCTYIRGLISKMAETVPNVISRHKLCHNCFCLLSIDRSRKIAFSQKRYWPSWQKYFFCKRFSCCMNFF